MFGIEKILARHFEGLDQDGILEMLSKVTGGEVDAVSVQGDEAERYSSALGWMGPKNHCLLLTVRGGKFGNVRAIVIQGSLPESGTAGS